MSRKRGSLTPARLLMLLKAEALNIHSGHGMAVPHRRLKCSDCDAVTHRSSLTKALREKKKKHFMVRHADSVCTKTTTCARP